ncbi:MAG: hypothetical protein V1791_00695, partial [Pseudomonadota bacterium]
GQVVEVRGKVERLLGLAATRAQWLKTLDEIHAALPDGMWLTSVKPVIESASPDQQAAPPPDVEAPAGLKSIEISGLGYRDKVTSGSIRDFRDKLRNTDLFAPGTDIIWQPAPAPDDFVIQFKILIVLKQPMDA